MSSSSLLNVASVSLLQSPDSSKAMSSINTFESCGRLVLLSHVNLRMATVELKDLEDDSRTCFAIEICCLAAAIPSACIQDQLHLGVSLP